MKTLKPVDPGTYEQIGAAYAICAQYPEIFGDVSLKKFCGMFVEVVDDDADRLTAMAPVMYRVLKKIDDWCQSNDMDEDLEAELSNVLSAIESEEDREESE